MTPDQDNKIGANFNLRPAKAVHSSNMISGEDPGTVCLIQQPAHACQDDDEDDRNCGSSVAAPCLPCGKQI